MAQNPSGGTILRGAIHPQAFNISKPCSSDGGPRSAPEISVRYGFELNAWLNDLLVESVAYDSWSWYTNYSNTKMGDFRHQPEEENRARCVRLLGYFGKS